MVEYQIKILKQAIKDKDKIKQLPVLRKNVEKLLELMKKDPFHVPPPYEMLIGDMKGLYSRRINRQHRLVYRVDEEERIVIVVSMWSHYESL